jgi:rod shape-determining protein MreD
MWQKFLIIILFFYIFALLQNSFFSHFNLFGAVPNLIFLFFFLLVFFLGKNNIYQVVFLAAIAGFFLDVFSFTYLGFSIVLLLIIGFLLKKTQSLLKNRQDNYSFIYFLPLFIIFLLIYNAFSGMTFSSQVIFSIIYNSLAVSVLYYFYKKFFHEAVDDRQLNLFKL